MKSAALVVLCALGLLTSPAYTMFPIWTDDFESPGYTPGGIAGQMEWVLPDGPGDDVTMDVVPGQGRNGTQGVVQRNGHSIAAKQFWFGQDFPVGRVSFWVYDPGYDAAQGMVDAHVGYQQSLGGKWTAGIRDSFDPDWWCLIIGGVALIRLDGSYGYEDGSLPPWATLVPSPVLVGAPRQVGWTQVQMEWFCPIDYGDAPWLLRVWVRNVLVLNILIHTVPAGLIIGDPITGIFMGSLYENSRPAAYDDILFEGEADEVTDCPAGGQPCRTNAPVINFTVCFVEPVTDFATGDVEILGTAGATTAEVSGSGTTYNVAVSGMTTEGSVDIQVPAGAAHYANGRGNLPSSDIVQSGCTAVTFDTVPPAMIVNQAADQPDPTNEPTIDFTVDYQYGVTGLANCDVIIGGTAGATTAVLSGHNIAVSGMTAPGTVTVSIPAGAAHDEACNGNLASTSTDNTVAFDNARPSVTVNQAAGQNDPTAVSPINFTAVFDEPVTDFETGDVTLSGTAGATTAIVSGSGTTYSIAVSGMTTPGTVVPSITAGVAHDATGNANLASTSTDNTVSYSADAPASAKLLPNGADAGLVSGTVSMLLPGGQSFYIQSENHYGGILATSPTCPGLDRKVAITGTMLTNGNFERYIEATSVTDMGAGTVIPAFIRQRDLGGADRAYDSETGAGQRGVTGGHGLNNIGTLATTMGTFVEKVDATHFTIDDGSGPVLCETANEITPNWDYLMLIGVSSCKLDGSDLKSMLRIRDTAILRGGSITGQAYRVNADSAQSETCQSPHPYPNNYNQSWTITKPSAQAIAVSFDSIVLAEGDVLLVKSPDGTVWHTYTEGSYSGWSPWVLGNTLILQLMTDSSGTAYGFRVTQKRDGSISPKAHSPMQLLPGPLTVSTFSSGYYLFYGLRAGTYTVTPTDPAFQWSPVFREVTLEAGEDVSGLDFLAY